MLDIIVQSIPHHRQEYDTMGNWTPNRKGDGWLIEVDEMGDWKKELLVAVHEMVEAALCKARGISEQSVSDFDKSHPNSSQPGDEPDAPYRSEHHFADTIEMQLAKELGVEWGSY